jgi:hypothetical protein
MWGVWVGLLGCRAPDLPAPEVEDVQPDYAFNGDNATVAIIGRKFYPQIEIDALKGGADVNRSFSVWLIGPDGAPNRYPFDTVGLIDDQHITATLEPGMPEGLYDVEVESPSGLRGRLDDGFVVTDTEADKLVIETERYGYEVDERARVTIKLLDFGGNVVPIDFEVAVVAVPEVGEVQYLDWTLMDGGLTPDGDGLRGFLQDGVAEVELGVTVPTDVVISADAWSPESPVTDASLGLSFRPGSDQYVELTLPVPAEPRPSFVAGEPFTVRAQLVDEFGNPQPGSMDINLSTTCSGFIQTVEINGPTDIQIVPQFATRPACPDDHVVSASPDGTTPPYSVLAGPIDHFAVYALFETVRAGDLFSLLVDPEDAFGNRTEWSGALTLADSVGGLIEPACTESDSLRICSARATLAAAEVTALVTGEDGTAGQSNPYAVLADDVPSTLELALTGPAAAGVPHPVWVRPYDGFGNLMNTADLGPDAFVLWDDSDDLACTFVSYELDGAARFDCTFTTALPDWVLSVDIPAHGLSASSTPFEVVNGPLAVVRFEGEAPVVAGQPLSLTLVGEDAYGNPYLVQSDPDVELWDDSGSFSLASATLGPDGTVSVQGSFLRAGATVLHASQGEVWLGSSEPIGVLAGPAAALQLTPLVPWAYVGEPTDVQVETIDTYGNRADFSGPATLSSATTAAPAVGLSLVNGVGIGTFTWPAPSFDEVLQGNAGAWEGEQPVVVASQCGISGPTAVVTFGGYPDAVACAGPDEATLITADLSSSVGSNLTGYALALLGEVTVSDTQPVLSLELQGLGRHELAALVVDSAGCGAEVPAVGWTGPDDGSPVGSIALSSPESDVEVIDTGGMTVDITGVSDCTRDPVALAELFVRSTGGELVSATVAPTGEGLSIQLDAAGDGSMTLVTNGGLAEGDELEIHAVSSSGAASGVLSLPIDGDNVRPVVLSQTPSGRGAGSISQVTLRFSEPLRSNSVIPSNFSVTGPTATAVTSATLSGDTVTLSLSPAVNGNLGGYMVTATDDVRDLAGNRLSGDWSGAQADYQGGFGDAGVTPGPLVCTATPTGLSFRPDGDPGEEGEADELTVSVSSVAAPAWWVLEVHDELGALTFLDRLVPLAANDLVTWSGRDQRGLVVRNGVWRVVLTPDDGLGNRGTGCEVLVTVANRGALP